MNKTAVMKKSGIPAVDLYHTHLRPTTSQCAAMIQTKFRVTLGIATLGWYPAGKRTASPSRTTSTSAALISSA